MSELLNVLRSAREAMQGGGTWSDVAEEVDHAISNAAKAATTPGNWYDNVKTLTRFGRVICEVLQPWPGDLQDYYERPWEWTAEYLDWKAGKKNFLHSLDSPKGRPKKPSTLEPLFKLLATCGPVNSGDRPQVNPPGMDPIETTDDAFDGRTPADL